jgi:hypothetical protein
VVQVGVTAQSYVAPELAKAQAALQALPAGSQAEIDVQDIGVIFAP